MQLSEEGRGPRGFTTGMSWVVSEDERAHAGWERHPRERAQHEPRGSGTAWHISLTSWPLTSCQGPVILAQLICLLCELPDPTWPPVALPVSEATTLHHSCKSQKSSNLCAAKGGAEWQSPLREMSAHSPGQEC